MGCLSGSCCGWWRWVLTFATFAQFFLTLGLLFNFSILSVSLQEDFGSSWAMAGFLGSLSLALSCLASPLCSLLARKLSRRTVAILGQMAFSAGLLTTSFVPVPTLGYAFFTFSILTGVGTNLANNASLALLLDWFAKANFSRASALAMLGSSSGMLAFSPLLTALITRFGWRNALRILGGGILVIGIATCLLLADPPSTEDYVRAPDESPDEEKLELKCMVPVNRVDEYHVGAPDESPDEEKRELECMVSVNRVDEYQVGAPDESPDEEKRELESMVPVNRVDEYHVGAPDESPDEEKLELKCMVPVNRVDEYQVAAPNESPDNEKRELESLVPGSKPDCDICSEDTDDDARECDNTINDVKVNASSQTSLKVGDEMHSHGRITSALINPEAWAWYFVGIFTFLGWNFFNINYASFMDRAGLDSDQIAAGIVYFALAETGGKVLVAVVGDRLPFLHLYLLLASCLLGTVVLGLLTVAKTFGAIVVLAVVSGVLRSGVYGTQYTAAAQLFHCQYGTNGVMVMTLIPTGLGILISSPLAGVLYDATGDYILSLLVIVAFFVCASAACVFIPVRRRIYRTTRAARIRPPPKG